MEQIDAILMGGRDPEKFDGQYKFQLEVGGRDILSRVLDALDNSDLVRRVFFIGPDFVKPRLTGRRKEYMLVEEQDSFWDNLIAGISNINGSALVVCSDLPFLTSRTVDWIVGNTGDGLYIPVVAQETLQQVEGTYSTYYWPMREYAFKWAADVMVLSEEVVQGKIGELVEGYRRIDPLSKLGPFKRLSFVYQMGGAESLYTLALNYLSKFIQQNHASQDVPLSRLRSKSDYERLLSHIVGVRTQMMQLPYFDTVLDVDSPGRLSIFRRGYDRIDRAVRAM